MTAGPHPPPEPGRRFAPALTVARPSEQAILVEGLVPPDSEIQAGIDSRRVNFMHMHYLEILGSGTFAIYIQGGIHHGLWQL